MGDRRWPLLDYLTAGCMVGVALTTLIGLGAIYAGQYSFRVVAGGLLVAGCVARVCRRRSGSHGREEGALPANRRLRPFSGWDTMAMWFALWLLVFGIGHRFEEVEGLRDPGVYTATGIELARTHDLGWRDPLVEKFGFKAVQHFFEDSQNFYNGKPRWLRFAGFYVDDPGTGHVTPQFLQGYALWMSLADKVGGVRGTQCLNAAFGALALLAFFCVMRKIVSPAAAGFGTLLLCFNTAQLWFARFPSNELMIQALLWGAVLLFAWGMDEEEESRAGMPAPLWGGLLLLFVAALCKVAAWVFLPVAAFYFGLAGCRHREKIRIPAAVFVFTLAGLLITLHAGVYAPFYAYGSWMFTVRPLGIAYAAVPFYFSVISGLAVTAGAMLCPAGRGLARFAPRFVVPAVVGIVTIALVATYLYQRHGYLGSGKNAGIWAEKTNLYEFGLYFGPLGLALAAIGLALLFSRIRRPGIGLLLILLLASSSFIVKRNLDAFHPWVARRWVIFLVPMVCAGAGFVPALIWGYGNVLWRKLTAGACAVVICVSMGQQGAALTKSRDFEGALESLGSLAEKLNPSELILTHPTGRILQWGPFLKATYGLDIYPQPYTPDAWLASLPLMRQIHSEGLPIIYLSDAPITGAGAEIFSWEIARVPVNFKLVPDGVHEIDPRGAVPIHHTIYVYGLDPARIPRGWWPGITTPLAVPQAQALPATLKMDKSAAPFLERFYDVTQASPDLAYRWTDGNGRIDLGRLLQFPLRPGLVRVVLRVHSGRDNEHVKVETYLNLDNKAAARRIGTFDVTPEWKDYTIEVDSSEIHADTMLEIQSLRPKAGAMASGRLGVMVESLRIE